MNYKRNRKKTTIVPAILSGITSVGLLYPAAFTPVRYVDGYGRDMEVIGQDMWRAVAHCKNDTQEESAELSTI